MKKLVINASADTVMMWDEIRLGGLFIAVEADEIKLLTYKPDEGFYWSLLNPNRNVGTHVVFRDGEPEDGYCVGLKNVIKEATEEDGITVYHFDTYAELYQNIADFCKKQEAQDT